jgi:hypothetical protein
MSIEQENKAADGEELGQEDDELNNQNEDMED